MSEPRRLLLNPSDRTKGYVIWDSGTVSPFGGQIPFTSTPFWSTYTPNLYGGVIRGAVITDWSGPGGYLVDWNAGIYNIGSAPAPPGAPAGQPFGDFHIITDITIDPNNPGQGYVLTASNQVIEFGGATAVAQPPLLSLGSDGSGQFARRLVMEWPSKKYYTLGSFGAIFHVNGAAAITTYDGAAVSPLYAWQYPYWHAAVDLVIRDFSNGFGWVMDLYGGLHFLNGQLNVSTGPYTNGFAAWRGIALVSDGQGGNPLTMDWLDIYGFVQAATQSTAPTVSVATPVNASTISNTTRPRISWNYSDAESNAQASALVRVFTSAQYGAVGFNPANSAATWEKTVTTRNQFFIDMDQDLGNGVYRAYVQATDSSGLASLFAFSQFTQAVTLPGTPTLTITALASTVGIQAQVHLTSPPVGARFGVQYRDSGTDPWRWVRGGDAMVPDGSGNATIVDIEAKLGVQRTYRAFTYILNADGTVVAGAFTGNFNGTLSDRTKYLMTNPLASTQGGVVRLQEFDFTRSVIAGVFQPQGRRNAIVVSDGGPKGMTATLKVWAPDNPTRVALETMIESAATLLLRDPYGRAFYVRAVRDIDWNLLRAAKLSGENTPTRDANVISIPVQEVDRPLAGPATGPLAILV